MLESEKALGSPCAGIANSIELNELNGEDVTRGTLHYLRGSWGLRSSVLSRIGLWEVPSIKRSSQWEKSSGHLTRGPNPQVISRNKRDRFAFRQLCAQERGRWICHKLCYHHSVREEKQGPLYAGLGERL